MQKMFDQIEEMAEIDRFLVIVLIDEVSFYFANLFFLKKIEKNFF